MLAFTRRRGVRYRRDGRVETVRALDQFRDQLSRDNEYFSSRVAEKQIDDDESWREEEEEKAATLTCISIPLIMLDNVRHVLQDGQMIGNWSSMYRKRCYHRDLRCLSLVGWTCQIATTVGFGLLFAGVLMSSGAWVKVKRRFRELRGV